MQISSSVLRRGEDGLSVDLGLRVFDSLSLTAVFLELRKFYLSNEQRRQLYLAVFDPGVEGGGVEEVPVFDESGSSLSAQALARYPYSQAQQAQNFRDWMAAVDDIDDMSSLLPPILKALGSSTPTRGT